MARPYPCHSTQIIKSGNRNEAIHMHAVHVHQPNPHASAPLYSSMQPYPYQASHTPHTTHKVVVCTHAIPYLYTMIHYPPAMAAFSAAAQPHLPSKLPSSPRQKSDVAYAADVHPCTVSATAPKATGRNHCLPTYYQPLCTAPQLPTATTTVRNKFTAVHCML